MFSDLRVHQSIQNSTIVTLDFLQNTRIGWQCKSFHCKLETSDSGSCEQ